MLNRVKAELNKGEQSGTAPPSRIPCDWWAGDVPFDSRQCDKKKGNPHIKQKCRNIYDLSSRDSNKNICHVTTSTREERSSKSPKCRQPDWDSQLDLCSRPLPIFPLTTHFPFNYLTKKINKGTCQVEMTYLPLQLFHRTLKRWPSVTVQSGSMILSPQGSESYHGSSFPTKWQTYPDFWQCPLQWIRGKMTVTLSLRLGHLRHFKHYEFDFKKGKTFPIQ